MDRVKKNQELKEQIIEKAFVENKRNKPVTDGPIDPDRFFTTPKSRTVFVSQEPYGDNGGWDISESLNAKESLKEQSRNGLPTFKNEVKCTSILNSETNNPMSTMAYDTYKETAAVINIKKEPNIQSRSNSKDLKIHASKNRELLQDQYSNLGLTSKDTTILAGTKDYIIKDIDNNTIEILGRRFDKEKDVVSIARGGHTYTKYDNGDGKGPIIAAPHPAASRFGQGNYEDNIHAVRKECTQREINLNQNKKSQRPASQASFVDSVIDTGADMCKSSMNYIKNNPKTVGTVAAVTVVAITGAFYLWKRYKNKHKKNREVTSK